MSALNQSLMTNKEEELRKIYEEEARKLQENKFKQSILKKLKTEDFQKDLPETSIKNIQKALAAVEISTFINLENGQKLLGLDECDVRKINLNYQEKKLIRERFEHLISLEKLKRDQETLDPNEELRKSQAQLVKIQKENMELTKHLEDLKQKELGLLKEVADILVGPTQQKIVQGILEEAKIVNLKARGLNQIITDSEMSRTSSCKKGISELSAQLDQLLYEKRAKSSK